MGRRGSKLRGGISQGGCIKFGSPSHASLEMRRARRSLPTVAWCIAKLPLPPHRGRSIPPRPPRCIHWVVQDNCMERLVFPLTATLPHRLRAHGKTPAGCGQGSVLGFGARARLLVQNSVTAQLLLISVAASARRAPKLGGKLGGCIFSSCAMLGTGGSDCCRQGSVPPSSPHAAAADVARTSAHASRVGQRPPQALSPSHRDRYGDFRPTSQAQARQQLARCPGRPCISSGPGMFQWVHRIFSHKLERLSQGI